MQKGLWVAVLVLANFISFHLPAQEEDAEVMVSGSKVVWRPVTLSFTGPEVDENDRENPFLTYRLVVNFTQRQDTFRVPGYFAADGQAHETGAHSGNIWRVHFTAPKPGTWQYNVSFRKGDQLAVSDSVEAGEPLALDGVSGDLEIAAGDPQAAGFYGRGLLKYNGSRYWQFAGTGDYFLKGGADSPENFLAYAGFDNTPASHYYRAHEQHWKSGDPQWHQGKGKGLIGAMNYLAGQGMNVIYMLTMNILGDGNDVFPWTSSNERYRFDCSKLAQWDLVFDHFDRLGILMHMVTQENENQLLLDAGFTAVQRKLYYRELVARFSHHLALVWNMGEENGRAEWYDRLGQTDKQRLSMAQYLRSVDPYDHPLVFHTLPSDPDLHLQTSVLLNQPSIDGVSLQIGSITDIHRQVKKWVKVSADSGKQWVVNLDEIGPHYRGVVPDEEDPRHDTIRVEAMWGTYMAGGAGTEWYFGTTDLTQEEFMSRETLWQQTHHALEFFRSLPLNEMQPSDDLLDTEQAWCLANPGEIYVVYFKQPGKVKLDLRQQTGTYQLQWYHPRTGGKLISGKNIKGDDWVELEHQFAGELDMAALIKKK